METETKLKECYELVAKINQTFGIKIDTGLKDYTVIWFRHYIVNKYKDCQLKVVYKPLKRGHASVQELRKRLPILTKDKRFADITEVIEKMDVDLYKKFLETHEVKRYGVQNVSSVANVKRVTMKEAVEILRTKPGSPLWNKDFKKWNDYDFQQLTA